MGGSAWASLIPTAVGSPDPLGGLYRVLLVVDGVVDDGLVGKKFNSWIVLNIVREVINVDKEEERAENTSLGDSWGDVDGGRYITLQVDLLCAVC